MFMIETSWCLVNEVQKCGQGTQLLLSIYGSLVLCTVNVMCADFV